MQATYFIPLFETAFPNGEVHRLPNASHYSPEDAPEEIAERVIAFIQGT